LCPFPTIELERKLVRGKKKKRSKRVYPVLGKDK